MSNNPNSALPNIHIMFRDMNKIAFWGILDNIKLEWVDDLGPNTKGACIPGPGAKSTKIQLSKRALKSKSHDEILKVLARQMLHAYLNMIAPNNSPETEGPDFKRHWERLLRIRQEYSREIQEAYGPNSGEVGAGRAGLPASDDKEITVAKSVDPPQRSRSTPPRSNPKAYTDEESEGFSPPKFNTFELSKDSKVLSFYVNWKYKDGSDVATGDYKAITSNRKQLGGNFATKGDPVDHVYTLLGRPPYININHPTKDLTLYKRYNDSKNPNRPTGYYVAFNKEG
ncbi:hypothetical protein IWQ62_000365 [Dispira parvispora]|uniref:SprT-like domain-containing protein n=1 Tax=Dispira parvispora TaxID=1520584 RepID=A0A9W8AUZ4_9FUNG|nr:hypothetical protein IWQ62_000365 [Dispira parvispora]